MYYYYYYTHEVSVTPQVESNKTSKINFTEFHIAKFYVILKKVTCYYTLQSV